MPLVRRTSRYGGPFRIVMLGDSITANGWYSKLASAVEVAQALQAPAVNIPGRWPLRAQPTATHLWYNSGVAGDDCVIETTPSAATVVASRVAKYKPDLVIFFLGINCVLGSLSDATCTENHGAILDEIYAQCPGVAVSVLSILCKGENWPRGANGPADATIDSKCAAIAAVAAARGAEFIDLRGPLFDYEAANNPTHLQILGPLTNADSNAVHPNQGAGAQFMSDTTFPYFTYAV